MDYIIKHLQNQFENNSNEVNLMDLLDKMEPKVLVKNAVMPMLEQLKFPSIRKIMRLMCIELYRNEAIHDFFKNHYIKPSHKSWTQIFQLLIDKKIIKKYDPKQLAIEFFDFAIYLLFECFLLNYNENSFDVVIDDLKQKFCRHVDFIFDMLEIKE